jgi:predicted DNA-binding ribbon-helix-helix protein
MKSKIVKRSIIIAGHKTSVSIEEAFWTSLKEIGRERSVTLSDLVGAIDAERQHGNLSSAIRLFVLEHYQSRAAGRAPIMRRPRELTAARTRAASVLRTE